MYRYETLKYIDIGHTRYIWIGVYVGVYIYIISVYIRSVYCWLTLYH